MDVAKLHRVSKSPGVYLWKDGHDNVLYVGKAANLQKRMLQYFKGAVNSFKTSALVENIHGFDTHICSSPKEALLLERNLIKIYDPPYNILLIDDKSFPYIRVSKDPTKFDISVVYRVSKSKNFFLFGPFPTGYGVRALCDLLKRETCFREGLPITNESVSYWEAQTQIVKEILTLKRKGYLQELEEKMNLAAAALQFEIASDYKKAIDFLKKIQEEQVVELSSSEDLDFVVAEHFSEHVFLTMFFYRWGVLTTKKHFVFKQGQDLLVDVETFLSNYYITHPLPHKLYLPTEFSGIEKLFYGTTRLIFPKTGIFFKILEVAKINNRDSQAERLNAFLNSNSKCKEVLQKLKEATKVAKVNHFVVFDSSWTLSTQPVSVAVVYRNGNKQKSEYRKFYHSSSTKRKADVEYLHIALVKYFETLKKLPDLVVVDGGQAQFNQAFSTLKSLNISLPVVALIKNSKHSVSALINSQGETVFELSQEVLNFLQGVQVEVDRFSKITHSVRHLKHITRSLLRNIKGVGEKIETKLLDYFKNYNNIYNANVEELARVVNMPLASKIFEFLRSKNVEDI